MPKAVHKLVKQGKSWALATYIVQQRKERQQRSRTSANRTARDKVLKTRPHGGAYA